MDSLELARKIADVILEKQGADILILDVQDLTTITDYFVICSANNRRQLSALQSSIREELKKEEPPLLPIGIEGTPDSGWILLDYNGVLVHLFEEETRHFYQLETLWEAGHVVARIQ